MIRYALRCEFDHEFEAWFSNSSAFDEQKAKALIECPHCGSLHVDKAIMAPMVRTSETVDARQADATRAMREALHKVRKHVEQNFDYVGNSFAKEARDMHDGIAPERAIYGEASREEIRELVEDGVPIAPLPAAPEAVTPKSKALN
ncbi:DUF1178 family protein [Asticcacaulis sp. BYS171W]|uniref:DUF1178 family protein n=1 Tax=Asticcacaulis aquaticus TaxID=2984212 RepID=A0ABT5HSU9_9CAUL|nr:DUF1178 family protein [Asticcacaulis aquaticus]MDC7683148.1 DUF1178 family protein [Asticcacaulis aquaticus]